MSESLIEKLRSLLIEKFNINPKEFKLHTPAPTEKWTMTFWPPSYGYHDYGISITAYKDGNLVVGSGPIYTNEGIREALFANKYERRLRKTKTEEEGRKSTSRHGRRGGSLKTSGRRSLRNISKELLDILRGFLYGLKS